MAIETFNRWASIIKPLNCTFHKSISDGLVPPHQQNFTSPLLGTDAAGWLARLDYFGWQATRDLNSWINLQRTEISPAHGPVLAGADFGGLDIYSPVPAPVARFGSRTAAHLQLLPLVASGSRAGKIIGVPGAGTHSFTQPPNNWESDNAVDIALSEGTPVRAVADAIVSKHGYGPTGDSPNGRFAGSRLHLEYGVEQVAFYTHLSKLIAQPGQHVKAGEIIGYSGSANGVSHLHFAVLKGDPLAFVRRGKNLPW